MTQQEQLETIGRICEAAGVRVPSASPVERVRFLAREHAARTAMVAALDRQAPQVANAPAVDLYTSGALVGVQSAFYAGDRYFANAEDARRARLELEAAAQREADRLRAARSRLAAAPSARRAA
jgi:hypothetical protein